MTKKRNYWRWTIGVSVLSLLFIAALSTTSARLTSAKIDHWTTMLNLKAAPAAPTPTGTDLIDGVWEIDGNINDASPGPTPDDWNTINCDGGNAAVKTGVIHDGIGTTIFTGGGSRHRGQRTATAAPCGRSEPPRASTAAVRGAAGQHPCSSRRFR